MESRNRRLAVMDLVEQTEALTAETYRRRREQIDRERSYIPYYVAQIVGVALVAGIVVAGMGTFQIFQLEGLARVRLNKVQEAEAELRGLSQKLVQAQEEERRSLSRELHDHVGQLLTAVRIGIGNLREALPPGSASARVQLDQTKYLAEEALASIRDLSMGLRPAMLDDLGLGAALEWQARQHSRVYGTPVSVRLSGDLDQLSDTWRTCTYRVVQEALNNVAKHAAATEVTVTMRAGEGRLSVVVRDNGHGFDFATQKGGLGLVGIKERVRELGGEMRIDSTPGNGAAVHVVIGPAIAGSTEKELPDQVAGMADPTRV